MFDHVKFGVSDFAASKAFFLKALEPLGVTIASEGSPAYGIELVAAGSGSLTLRHTQLHYGFLQPHPGRAATRHMNVGLLRWKYRAVHAIADPTTDGAKDE